MSLFEEATRNISAAAEQSLKLNLTDNSWPVCCSMGDYIGTDRTGREILYENPVIITDRDRNWTSGCYFFDKSKDVQTSCFCEHVAASADETHHRWDAGLLEAFKTAGEAFEKAGYDRDNIPFMFIGTREGFFALYPLERDASYFSNCFHYDPRIRPWYTQFVAETDRQLLFLFDRSSSMSDILINGDGYTEYVRNITNTIVNSLRSNDLVRFFSFGTTVQKIEPPLATECFFNPSSYMLEQLENILESLLTKIDENESYDLSYIVEALEAMAESEEWEESREKILLLFTDDQNSDRTSSDMTRIDNAITRMGSNGIKVVILDFGDGAGQLKRSNENEFMNQLNVRSILADVQDDLQRLSFNITTELLSKTAAKTVPTAADREVVYSSPYMDFGGASGEIITIGQPIYEPNGTVFGAVGVDLVVLTRGIRSTTNLNLGIFDGRFLSYLFIFDRTGIVIYHPYKPLDINRPVMYYDVEKNPTIRQRISDSLTSTNENEVFTHHLTGTELPVAMNYDGSQRVKYVRHDVTYKWKMFKTFVIGIVIFESEEEAVIAKLEKSSKSSNTAGDCADFVYHSNIDRPFDLAEWQIINERVVNYQHVMTMFGVQSYLTEKKFNQPELIQDVEDVRRCLKSQCDTNTLPLTVNAMADICSTAVFDTIWAERYNALSPDQKSLISR